MTNPDLLAELLAGAAEPDDAFSSPTTGERPPFVDSAIRRIRDARLTGPRGRVESVVGIAVEARGVEAPVGEICEIRVPGQDETVRAEVIGFRGPRTVLMPLGRRNGIGPGNRVARTGHVLRVPTGPSMLGRILDGLGRPIDGRPLPPDAVWANVAGEASNPLDRPPIRESIATGVGAIDGLLTLGQGQRVGIFSGSGVGKSTLLGMIARRSSAAVNVIALIGERGREVREFLEDSLGAEGLARSVVIVATSDTPPLERFRGAFLATTIAESFRDAGHDVLFVMDSVTRFAAASREIGLALGEPPTRLGYPPSFFSNMPLLVERLGRTEKGSITGLYTVLVEGDDLNEPVSDTMRGLLDGHLVLSRDLAHRNHFPAIDVLQSVSRLMAKVASPEHRDAAAQFREIYAAYRDAEDLIHIGAYREGSSDRIDRAVRSIDAMNQFLRQAVDEARPFEDVVAALAGVMEQGDQA